jgi:hypothetical protein
MLYPGKRKRIGYYMWSEVGGTLGENKGNLNKVWILVNSNVLILVHKLQQVNQTNIKMLIIGETGWKGLWKLSGLSWQFSENLKLLQNKKFIFVEK